VNERVVVTGAAGFIGSHLCERLLDEGYTVVGVDSFTDYYDPARKRLHLATVAGRPAFTLVEDDLTRCDIGPLLDGARCVFHLAAQAGVRQSWGSEFGRYLDSNVLATQRVLEALKERPSVKLVHSSSSSVYGETRTLPMREDHPLVPVSPYGATKLSAEQLCELYRINHGVSYVALRYFTVYGPRQRPDMAFSRFIVAALAGRQIEVYGDGAQTRDFTYVSDAVAANIEALAYDGGDRVFNIGGGSRASILDVLGIIGAEIGGALKIEFRERARGDVRDTWADTTRAARELGYEPRIALADGVRNEISWYRAYLATAEGGPRSHGAA
jgi:nucleoside-diphosphate-sugar epimerase